MWGRRIAYLVALFATLVFYCFYREWFSWFFLVALVALPWFSLALSLPAMLTVKAGLRCPAKTRQGMPLRTALQLNSLLPTPPVLCTIRLVNSLTGERFLGQPGERIPTDNCGMMTISYPQMYVYDYLGLFRRRLHRSESLDLFIEPKPIPEPEPLRPEGKGAVVWRPKAGGGFSEMHDLRLYRPGDDLRHIHWKMSAKTGKLIYREPMEPAQKGYILNLTLSGTPQELNRKLGRLVWSSRSLLEKGLEHTVRCLTGKGLLVFTVSDEVSLENCLKGILAGPCAQEGTVDTVKDALWQRNIGGGSHEAG